MSSSQATLAVDQRLAANFTAERLRAAFETYREGKRDYFQPDVINVQMGSDGVELEALEKELDKNAENISKKVLAGKHLFYPFREVDVLKNPSTKDTRTLSVASVRDTLVQLQLYETVYDDFESLFRRQSVRYVSFAYRRHFSTSNAATVLFNAIRSGYVHAIDADLTKYFDTIPHEQLLAKIAEVVDPNSKTFTLLRRFISTDRVPHNTYSGRWVRGLHGKRVFHKIKPDRTPRIAGVPQGGVLSGMLANLYLHEFDIWVVEEVGNTNRF